jgi:hypothetical protein
MRLHPNPPRLVTVALAVALGALGLVLALPIDAALPLVEPVLEPIVAAIGLNLDRELGYLCLFLSPSLLVAGSLVPGI